MGRPGERQPVAFQLRAQPPDRPRLYHGRLRSVGLSIVAQGAHSEGTARGRRVELRGRSIPLARALVVVASLVPTAVYLYVALHRIGYPYELEWLEGGAVEIVRRVAEGQAIYVRPSVHYVPYPYTPLYFWVSGALAHVTGVGFLPLRLVSLLSSLGCCVVLIRIVWSETGDPVAGILASGLFTASFAVSGAWFDIGRVDSFSLSASPTRHLYGRAERRPSAAASVSGSSSSWPSWPSRTL